MTVLHLISSGGMYGAEAVILTLAREMQRNGERHVLGVFHNSANPNLELHEIASQSGVESRTLLCNGRADASTVSAIRMLVKELDADVVHTHGYKADIYGYLAMRGRGVPLVSTCHGDPALVGRVYGVLDRFCLKRFSAVAAVSAFTREKLLRAGLRASKLALIHNGIQWEPFAAAARARGADVRADEASLVVGFAGRLSHEKGIDLLIEVIRDVLAEWPNTQFLIAGEGPERSAAEQAIAKGNLGGNVTLLGRCEDMPAFFASVDVLLSPSRSEGLPMALLEAMASRVPVVATAVGDVPNIVQNEQTGLLVPALDVPAMQKAVVRLLSDGSLRERLGEAGQRLVQEDFSARRMAEKYAELYIRVIPSRAA